MRLCSQIRSLERTRNVPILAVAEADNNTRLVRGLEIGVNDYLIRPIDKNEMLARVRTQIKKKRYTERLRDNVQMSIEMAITDALTGLFNRRYMETHLATLVEQAASRGKPIAVMVLDIDYFKSVNDTHGHDAGDDVLREFALRIRKSIRNIDLACRYGGEEFVLVMPETDMAVATMVAERLRRRIATESFAIQQGARSLDVTISIGIAAFGRADRQRPRRSLNAPTRRSIAPSATAAIAWCRRPPESLSRRCLRLATSLKFRNFSSGVKNRLAARPAWTSLVTIAFGAAIDRRIQYPAECSGPPHLLGPRGVRPARKRCEWPPRISASGRPPNLTLVEMQRAPTRRLFRRFAVSRRAYLIFDFCDTRRACLRDRIVFLLRQLLGLRARILLGHVIVAGVGAGDELDFQTGGFGHGYPRNCGGVGRNLAANRQMSRKPQFSGITAVPGRTADPFMK